MEKVKQEFCHIKNYICHHCIPQTSTPLSTQTYHQFTRTQAIPTNQTPSIRLLKTHSNPIPNSSPQTTGKQTLAPLGIIPLLVLEHKQNKQYIQYCLEQGKEQEYYIESYLEKDYNEVSWLKKEPNVVSIIWFQCNSIIIFFNISHIIRASTILVDFFLKKKRFRCRWVAITHICRPYGHWLC